MISTCPVLSHFGTQHFARAGRQKCIQGSKIHFLVKYDWLFLSPWPRTWQNFLVAASDTLKTETQEIPPGPQEEIPHGNLCMERLWSLPHCKYSKPAWKTVRTMCSGGLEQIGCCWEAGLGDLQRPLAALLILCLPSKPMATQNPSAPATD